MNTRKLTKRDEQLALLVAEGLSNREVAEKLGIAEGTVKVYLSRLYDKIEGSEKRHSRYKLMRMVMNMTHEQAGDIPL